jgi:RNA polymerase sigma factor (sigma-70 family)
MVMGTALAAIAPSQPVQAEVPALTLGQIDRYCSVCWRNARLPEDRWDDCTQEVYRRLLERVPVAGWNRLMARDATERREFVRAIDAVKKKTQRDRQRYQTITVESSINDVSDDDRQTVEHVSRELLSERQQQILRMSFQGASVADISQQLAMSPQRVSDEKYKAIQKLRSHFHPV